MDPNHNPATNRQVGEKQNAGREVTTVSYRTIYLIAEKHAVHFSWSTWWRYPVIGGLRLTGTNWIHTGKEPPMNKWPIIYRKVWEFFHIWNFFSTKIILLTFHRKRKSSWGSGNNGPQVSFQQQLCATTNWNKYKEWGTKDNIRRISKNNPA